MNIVLTNSAKFNPYTFDEMLKPLAMATEAYSTVQSGIAELGTKADLMRMYANEVPDSKTANIYNSYARDLEKQANLLAKHGLTPTSRQGLLNMKRRYSSEVTPIENAVEYRKKVAEEQRKLSASNPNLMFTEDFSNMNLDRILENPTLGYSTVSGDDLYKKAAAVAEAAAKRIVETNPTLGGQYYSIKEGYGEEAARQFLLNSANIPEIDNALNGLFKEAGADKLSARDQQRARELLKSGALSGMTYKETLKENRNALTAYQAAQLKSEGFNTDGTVDVDSPIWSMKGYTKDENGKLVKSEVAGKVWNTKDGLVRVNPDGTITRLTDDEKTSNTPSSLNKSYITKEENYTFGKYKREGLGWWPFGPSDKPDIKGTRYVISGTSEKAKQAKTDYYAQVRDAIASGKAIVLQGVDDDMHRPFFKVGKYGKDIPDNIDMNEGNFGDVIKRDKVGNIAFDLSKDLEIFDGMTDTIKQLDYGGVPYDLSRFIIVKVPSTDKYGDTYVGIPKEDSSIKNKEGDSPDKSIGGTEPKKEENDTEKPVILESAL